jgi:hypothetical protein
MDARPIEARRHRIERGIRANPLGRRADDMSDRPKKLC